MGFNRVEKFPKSESIPAVHQRHFSREIDYEKFPTSIYQFFPPPLGSLIFHQNQLPEVRGQLTKL